MSSTTLCVILAAGGGARFSGDTHKLLAPLAGRPVIAHAIAAARSAGPVLVVTGAIDLDRFAGEGVRLVTNPDWREGQASSLAVAVDVADRDGYEAIVVGLGDQPLIAASAWTSVAASQAPIAVATYDGRPRNPVRLARSVWPLLSTHGDEGARQLVRSRPDLVEPVPCSGSPADIDTATDLDQLEELLRWQSR